MSLRIATNVSSLNVQHNLSNVRSLLDKSLERLASGYRINRAGDDAAGLALSERLRAKTRGLIQAERNASDGLSLIQVAEGGLSEIQDMLIRLRELGVQAATDTVGDQEREFLNKEFQALSEEIERVANVTEFNGTALLDGSGGTIDLQINTGGENLFGGDRISINAYALDSNLDVLGIDNDNVSTKQAARASLSHIDKALDYVSGIRAELGSIDNRLASTVRNLGVYIENMSAANSRIKDVDVASETAELTRNNILTQAGISVLSQANSIPNMALELLK